MLRTGRLGNGDTSMETMRNVPTVKTVVEMEAGILHTRITYSSSLVHYVLLPVLYTIEGNVISQAIFAHSVQVAIDELISEVNL